MPERMATIVQLRKTGHPSAVVEQRIGDRMHCTSLGPRTTIVQFCALAQNLELVIHFIGGKPQ